MTTQYKTMKQRFAGELKIAAATLTAAAAIATMGVIANVTCAYVNPVSTQKREIPGCMIVSSTYGSDFPTVSYLTAQGKLGTANLPKELERTVEEKLRVEHKSVPATMEETVTTYKTIFGVSNQRNTTIKYLEELK